MKKNLSKNLQSGFTLIELLVVVAIIGILASVVLASLNTARSKGSDAAIKANLDNMRAEAAIYYDGTGAQTYGVSYACTVTSTGTVATSCLGVFSDTTMQAALKQAASSSGATVTGTTDATSQLYGIEAVLKADTTKGWCVDSAGKSEQVTLATAGTAAAVTACP